MNHKPRVSAFAHPLFTSTLPGLAGLAVGIVAGTCASVVGYRVAHMVLAFKYPRSYETHLASAALLNVVLSCSSFLGGILVGIVLMLFYRRNLREHHDLLVERLLLSREEKRRQMGILQLITIEWPLWLIVLSYVAFCLWSQSYQGVLIALSGGGGMFASVPLTYRERMHIYEDALARTAERIKTGSSSLLKRSLTRREKMLAVTLTAAFVAFLVFLVWGTADIVAGMRKMAGGVTNVPRHNKTLQRTDAAEL